MKWLTFEIRREPGFRFNLIDLGLISALVLLSFAAYQVLPESTIYLIPLYLGGSFFLFCNLFRIGNRLEPWWYIPFFAAALYGVISMDMERFWWLVLLLFEPLKFGLILYRINKGPYRGIGYRYFGARER